MSLTKLVACRPKKDRDIYAKTSDYTALNPHDEKLTRRIDISLKHIRELEPLRYDGKLKSITFNDQRVLISIRHASTEENRCKQLIHNLINNKPYISDTLKDALAVIQDFNRVSGPSQRHASFATTYSATNLPGVDYKQEYLEREREISELRTENQPLQSKLWAYESRSPYTQSRSQDESAGRYTSSTAVIHSSEGKSITALEQENEALKSRVRLAEKQKVDLKENLTAALKDVDNLRQSNDLLKHDTDLCYRRLKAFEKEMVEHLRYHGYQEPIQTIVTFRNNQVSVDMNQLTAILKNRIKCAQKSSKELQLERYRLKEMQKELNHAKSTSERDESYGDEYGQHTYNHTMNTTPRYFETSVSSANDPNHTGLQHQRVAETQSADESGAPYSLQYSREADVRETYKLQSLVKKQEAKIEDLQQQLELAHLDLNAKKSKLYMETNKTNQLQARQIELEAMTTGNRQELKQAESSLKKKEELIKFLEKQLKSTRQDLKVKDSQLNIESEIMNQLQETKRKLEATNTEIMEELQQTQSLFKEKEDLIEGLRQQLKSVKQELYLANEKTSRLQEAQQKLTSTTTGSMQELQQVQIDLENTKAILQDHKHKVTIYQRIEEKYEDLTKTNEKLQRELKRAKEETSLYLEKTSLLSETVAKHEQLMKEMSDKINQMKQEYQTCQRDLKEAQQALHKVTSKPKVEESRCEKENAHLKKCLDHAKDESEKHSLLWQRTKFELQSAQAALKEHESIKYKYSEAEKQVRELKYDNRKLRESRDETQKQLEINYGQIDEVTVELTTKASIIHSQEKELQTAKDKLRGLDMTSHHTAKEIRDLQQRNAELLDRLEAETNARISANESSLENISIKARPMNIAEEYMLVLSNSWLDAKTALDDIDPDDKWEVEKVKLLFSLLQVSELQTGQLYEDVLRALVCVLRDPITHLMEHGPSKGGHTRLGAQPLPENLTSAVVEFFKRNCDGITLDFLAQNIIRKLKNDWKVLKQFPDLDVVFAIDEVSQYVKDCAALAWKMMLQQPRMYFEASRKGSTWEDDGYAELMCGSNPETADARILYYKNPSLLYRDNVLVKATVFVHSQRNA